MIGTLRKLAIGLAVAATMLVSLEIALRVLWKIVGAPATDVIEIRNRFAPDAARANMPGWFWNAMAPGQRSNVVGNAMAYPDPEFIFRVRPNPGGAPVRGFAGINALGFRTAHLDGSAPPAGAEMPLRVLHLGDSCAWGWGIRRFEQTVSPQVESRLAAAGIPAEVINLGEPGFTTTQGRKLFDQWFPKLRPDVVVLQFGWNDRLYSRGFTDRQVMRYLPILDSRPAKALMSTALYRAFCWAAGSVLPQPADPANEGRRFDPVIDNEHMRVPLAESVENYRAMITQAKVAGAKVLVILPPYKPGVPGLAPRIRDFNHEIAAAFRDEAVFLPLADMRETSPDVDSYFDADGIHPNLKGVRYIAAAIAEEIVAELHPTASVAVNQ